MKLRDHKHFLSRLNLFFTYPHRSQPNHCRLNISAISNTENCKIKNRRVVNGHYLSLYPGPSFPDPDLTILRHI